VAAVVETLALKLQRAQAAQAVAAQEVLAALEHLVLQILVAAVVVVNLRQTAVMVALEL
jgi:hypothetical protein